MAVKEKTETETKTEELTEAEKETLTEIKEKRGTREGTAEEVAEETAEEIAEDLSDQEMLDRVAEKWREGIPLTATEDTWATQHTEEIMERLQAKPMPTPDMETVRRLLKDMGYSQTEIDAMTLQEAWDTVQATYAEEAKELLEEAEKAVAEEEELSAEDRVALEKAKEERAAELAEEAARKVEEEEKERRREARRKKVEPAIDTRAKPAVRLIVAPALEPKETPEIAPMVEPAIETAAAVETQVEPAIEVETAVEPVTRAETQLQPATQTETVVQPGIGEAVRVEPQPATQVQPAMQPALGVKVATALKPPLWRRRPAAALKEAYRRRLPILIWKMGRLKSGDVWKAVIDPQRQINLLTVIGTRNLPVPPRRYATGKGSAAKTLQWLGKGPRYSGAADLGVVDVFWSRRGAKLRFGGKGLKTDVGTRVPGKTKGIAIGVRGGGLEEAGPKLEKLVKWRGIAEPDLLEPDEKSVLTEKVVRKHAKALKKKSTRAKKKGKLTQYEYMTTLKGFNPYTFEGT